MSNRKLDIACFLYGLYASELAEGFPQRLSSVYLAVDYYFRIPLTKEMAETAVQQLVALGLIRVEGELFAVTDAGKELITSLPPEFIPATALASRLPEASEPFAWSISQEEYEAAVTEAHEKFEKAKRELDERERASE